MVRPRIKYSVALVVLALVLAAAALATHELRAPREKPIVGLFTTMPIYWAETRDIADLLDERQEVHWARQALEEDYLIQPLDTLAASGASNPLANVKCLLLAQPRALSPAENVALDAWVRSGGRLLLFADPMMTGHSAFPIGDRRRPQDVILLSPILSHWGLDLRFDDSQPMGLHPTELFGIAVPVDLPGHFVAVAGSDNVACRIDAHGLAADCRIGKGHALIVADAALLDADEGEQAERAEAFEAMVGLAFEQH